jgi:hypothetical protein
MSNTTVGPVYDTIIAEVINAVRVDFEENGVDDGALEDLKKVRLSQSLLAPPPLRGIPAILPCAPSLDQSNKVIFRSVSSAVPRCTLFSSHISLVWR